MNDKQDNVKPKTVADYFGQSEFDMHIVDLFLKVLANNKVVIFNYDAGIPKDVRISIIEQETFDKLNKVPTVEKKEDVDKEL